MAALPNCGWTLPGLRWRGWPGAGGLTQEGLCRRTYAGGRGMPGWDCVEIASAQQYRLPLQRDPETISDPLDDLPLQPLNVRASGSAVVGQRQGVTG